VQKHELLGENLSKVTLGGRTGVCRLLNAGPTGSGIKWRDTGPTFI